MGDVKTNYENLIKSTSKKERGDIIVYVGMSGGVDSSVTAYLLKEKGFNVKGIYMQCWGSDDPNCKAHQDRADAIKVASFLNIPIDVWDFEKEYKEKVIEYFFNEYKKGRTPNPDILCNSEIKFKLFLNKALKSGADYIATGHYAKIINFGNLKSQISNNKEEIRSKTQKTGGGSLNSLDQESSNISSLGNKNSKLKIKNYNTYSRLERDVHGSLPGNLYIASGSDMWKDQSYFLSRLDRGVLNKVIFPIGSLIKSSKNSKDDINSSVRKLADSINLPVSDKEDSTGICFLEGIDVQDFLKTEINEKTGKVLNTHGEEIGEHRGVWFYTIGQRRGFDITKYQGNPMYVIEKDVEENVLVVGEEKDLKKREFEVESLELRIKYYELSKLIDKERIYVRIRNLGDFEQVKDIKELDANKYQISIINYLKSVAPGQFAVLYWIPEEVDEKVIVGSGVIC